MLLLVAFVSAAHATTPPRAGQPGHIGFGLGVGSAVAGASVKWMPAADHSFQGLVGVSPGGGAFYGYNYGPLAVELDYLYEMPIIADVDPCIIRWNLGFGGSVVTASPLFVGAQAIVGLELDFVDVPLDFVVEYRPGIGILVGDQGGLGFNPIGVGAHIRVWL